MKSRIQLGVMLTLLALPIAPALAAKGGGAGGSTITLVQVAATTASTASADPSFGAQVTFAVSTNRTDTPWVYLNCFQDGRMVYAESHPMYQSNSTNDPGMFSLGPSAAWAGGAADCNAYLVGFNHQGNDQILASTSFHVNA